MQVLNKFKNYLLILFYDFFVVLSVNHFYPRSLKRTFHHGILVFYILMIQVFIKSLKLPATSHMKTENQKKKCNKTVLILCSSTRENLNQFQQKDNIFLLEVYKSPQKSFKIKKPTKMNNPEVYFDKKNYLYTYFSVLFRKQIDSSKLAHPSSYVRVYDPNNQTQ